MVQVSYYFLYFVISVLHAHQFSCYLPRVSYLLRCDDCDKKIEGILAFFCICRSLIHSDSPTNHVIRRSGAISEFLLIKVVNKRSTVNAPAHAPAAVPNEHQAQPTTAQAPLPPQPSTLASLPPQSATTLGETYYVTVSTYEKYPTEYYIQGSGVKALYRDLKVQPGDMVKLKSDGWDPHGRGHPVVILEIVPREENPYAEDVLQSKQPKPSKP